MLIRTKIIKLWQSVTTQIIISQLIGLSPTIQYLFFFQVKGYPLKKERNEVGDERDKVKRRKRRKVTIIVFVDI